jgi:tetratricopeptide (TPR) repeat protein
MSPLTRSVLEAQGSGSQDGPQGLLWTPLAADLYGFLGRIHARHRMAEAATACYGWAYLVLPRESIYARHMAQLAIAEGEEGRAIALLTRAVAADPSDVEARMALGFEFAAQGFAEEARTHFEAAVALAPGFADLRYNLGLLYAAQGLGPKAMEQFRRALQINPSYIPARQSLAAAYCRAGQAEDGLREYERVLRQGFQSADMLAKMGQAALDLGRTEEALQYLERASFVNPDYAPSYYFLGQAYKAKGLRNKARAAWRRHLEKTDAWESATPWAPES